MRSTIAIIFTIFLAGAIGLGVQAQSIPAQSAFLSSKAVVATAPARQAAIAQSAPGEPARTAEEKSGGSIHGTVTDSTGDVVVGAHVTLVPERPNPQRTLITDGAGFFTFTGLNPGTFDLTVTSQGFAPWVAPRIVLTTGENHQLPQIALQIASSNTSVKVTPVDHELAEQQMHVEEKQRVLGFIPNFYASYVWDAQPLTPGQKFRLALRSSVDPVAFIGTGAIAGIQQWQNDFSGYGQGAQGYAKRYGANFSDGFISTMIGGAILPSILHQDPRYFYKGTGSIRSRALYAISTVVICKGDNGLWQPNYSNVLGSLAAAGISNIYYPSTDRGTVTIDNALIGIASGAASALFQEFLIKKISRGVPPAHLSQP